MGRNKFEDNDDRIDDLLQDPVEDIAQLIMNVNDGVISIHDARRILGLPPLRESTVNDLLAAVNVEPTEGETPTSPEVPVENLGGLYEDPEEELAQTLQQLRGNQGFTTTAQHLEREDNPTRWERG